MRCIGAPLEDDDHDDHYDHHDEENCCGDTCEHDLLSGSRLLPLPGVRER
jgi:hypothetical protein